MNRLLQDLNDSQLEAVKSTDGPLLVIAGAGSGKTRVLTRRFAYILTERLAEPHQLMAVTFTNKAAGEMRERVASLLGGEIPGMNVSTFHSFGARFLRQEAEVLGYDKNFSIFDAADSQTLVKNCIRDLKLSSSQFTPKSQLRKISGAKDKLISASKFESAAQGYFESTTAAIYSLYQSRLTECNCMDFDDLLFNSVRLLRANQEICDRYRSRYKYLMVDEYQDTNHVQYLLLKELLGDNDNICVVGDEDQAIYGWRGADIRNILEFERDFPGARIVKLEQNYRSTDLILAAASSVIKNNEARKAKTLWTDQDGGEKLRLFLVDNAQEEAVQIVKSIAEKEQPDFGLNNVAILYRTNAQSRTFEEQLRLSGIPYQICGGISFYQRKEIKDLLAYLKLLVNGKDDVAFERIINYPKRGIGAKTVSDITELARRFGRSCFDVVAKVGDFPELAGRAAKLSKFGNLICSYLEKLETLPPDLLTAELVEELKLFEDFKAEDPIIGQTRIENVEAFIEGIAEYARSNPHGTLADYLAEISLFTDLDKEELGGEKVTMMTIHSAKGLEYDVVFLVGLEEGLFPLGRTVTEPMELEEERRLFYVGSTRARKRLTLSSATSRFRFGEVESIPSRFIEEIADELIERFDFRTRRHYETTSHSLPGLRLHSSARSTVPEGVHYEYEGEEMYRSGRIVHHPTFGRGKIIKSEGFGDSLRLEIMFTGIGIKKIMARYAKLTVMG